jgi:exosortase
VFGWLQLDVARDGTLLSVQGLPVSVEAACSGLNTLQAMLIAGTLAAYVQIGDRKHYWWHLPALVAVAWLANTLRILVICVMALSAGPELASGSFHFLGGWAVLCGMFCICWIIFHLAARYETAPFETAPLRPVP